MAKLFSALILLTTTICFAQDFQADPLSMTGQASLINLRFEIGGKSAKLFVVGSEAAKINFDKDFKLLELTAFKGNETKETLMFTPDKGYYLVKNPPAWGEPYQIQVKAKVNGSEKIIKLQIKP